MTGFPTTVTTTATGLLKKKRRPLPMCRELLLRCDCGVEHMDIDLWFTADSAGLRNVDREGEFVLFNEFDEGYLSVHQAWGNNQPWRDRAKAIWALLRGREYLISSVIFNPEDHKQIREFFLADPSSATGADALPKKDPA